MKNVALSSAGSKIIAASSNSDSYPASSVIDGLVYRGSDGYEFSIFGLTDKRTLYFQFDQHFLVNDGSVSSELNIGSSGRSDYRHHRTANVHGCVMLLALDGEIVPKHLRSGGLSLCAFCSETAGRRRNGRNRTGWVPRNWRAG